MSANNRTQSPVARRRTSSATRTTKAPSGARSRSNSRSRTESVKTPAYSTSKRSSAKTTPSPSPARPRPSSRSRTSHKNQYKDDVEDEETAQSRVSSTPRRVRRKDIDENHDSVAVEKEEKVKPTATEHIASDSVSTSWFSSMKQRIQGSAFYGDYGNMAVLLMLYTLQGVPMGLSTTVPMVMAERRIGYQAQAIFSLVSIPFSVKLLWAPLVDSFYSPSIGRRKSWILPVQLLCAVMLVLGGAYVDTWIGEEPIAVAATATAATTPAAMTVANGTASVVNTTLSPSSSPISSSPSSLSQQGGVHVELLTAFFMVLYVLMATQDIAVDAWALTMLRRRNVGWASSINTIGQFGGSYAAYIGYMVLSSKDMCVKWFGLDDALTGIAGFMQFWGVVFFVCTVLIAWFKVETTEHAMDATERLAKEQEQQQQQQLVLQKQRNAANAITAGDAVRKRHVKSKSKDDVPEQNIEEEEEEEVEGEEGADEPKSLAETIDRLKLVLQLKPVQWVILYLLTVRITTSPSDNVAQLRLLELGMTREDQTTIVSIVSPISLLVPVLASKYIAGPDALQIHLYVFPFRVLMAFAWAGVVAVYPHYAVSHPKGMVAGLSVLWILQSVVAGIGSVSMMSFFSIISDPRIGGTFITLLNTASNFGYSIARYIVLTLVPYLNKYECLGPLDASTGIHPVIAGMNNAATATADATTAAASTAAVTAVSNAVTSAACVTAGGTWTLVRDGYMIEVIIFGIIGMLWMAYLWRPLMRIARLPFTAWRVKNNSNHVAARAPVSK